MDFSLILLLALVVSASIILLYRIFSRSATKTKQPILLEYARALFPVILIVFLLRSFLVEPFRIPSGSMLPNLYVGDFILVNKFKYGIRLPVINQKILPLGSPDRGDVIVFLYPSNPKVNYIKRVVGLPGDELVYQNKTLRINGVEISEQRDGDFVFPKKDNSGRKINQFIEFIGDAEHRVLIDQTQTGFNHEAITVPQGHYFVMGDNRDQSNDSRYWGFVPESHIVGQAFFIWFSWKSATGGGVDWSRIGNAID